MPRFVQFSCLNTHKDNSTLRASTGLKCWSFYLSLWCVSSVRTHVTTSSIIEPCIAWLDLLSVNPIINWYKGRGWCPALIGHSEQQYPDVEGTQRSPVMTMATTMKVLQWSYKRILFTVLVVLTVFLLLFAYQSDVYAIAVSAKITMTSHSFLFSYFIFNSILFVFVLLLKIKWNKMNNQLNKCILIYTSDDGTESEGPTGWKGQMLSQSTVWFDSIRHVRSRSVPSLLFSK